jgi:outer membrane murein-binding lipoprotein Lpp
MDQWITFAQDRWYWIIAAVVVLFIVIGLVKTVIKWILVIVIVGAIVLYGANYKDKLQSIGTSVVTKAGEEAKEGAAKALASEAKDAKYTANQDGSFVITTKSLKVEGKLGSNDVQVTFLGAKFTMNADGIMNTFIEQAKKNSKS